MVDGSTSNGSAPSGQADQTASTSDPRFPGHFFANDQGEVQSLQDAALSIPDADAMSVSSLHTTDTDRAADEETERLAGMDVAASDMIPLDGGETISETASVSSTNSSDAAATAVANDTRHETDWNHLLGLSGQGLNAANAATSLGFAAARQTTSFGLALAKRITQGVIALPAMALDGTLGNAPSFSNYAEPSAARDGQQQSTSGYTVQPTIASIAHSAVGGMFDVISALAVGGLDIGTAVTGAGLGAAASGVEGVRRALGSEVLRSLGAFSRLVRREWNSKSDTLPPGGIPQYSILGITQALTAWVSIQMVTREYYEGRMMRNLDVVDLDAVHATLRAAKDEIKSEPLQPATKNDPKTSDTAMKTDEDVVTSTPKSRNEKPAKKRKKVRILDDETLPGDEGDIIDAEIGDASDVNRESAAAADVLNADNLNSEPSTSNLAPDAERQQGLSGSTAVAPQALTDAEAIAGLKRYSRLVLGVYGGVALAWLGSLPPDLMQAAGTSVENEQQHNISLNSQANDVQQQGQQRRRRQEVDPLLISRPRGRSAAQDDQTDFIRAAASLDLDDSELIEDEANSVLTSSSDTDEEFVDAGAMTPKRQSMIGNVGNGESHDVLFAATQDGTVTPTQDAQSPHLGGASKTSPAEATVSNESAPGRTYSYYDVLMGTADGVIFNRLGGLEDGLAREGDYAETHSQAGSAEERLRRLNNPVARPSKPRYYVVTDHTQRKIILVLRGSLSLGDIAIDLTCESANFNVQAWDEEGLAEAAVGSSGDSISQHSSNDSDAPAAAEDFSLEAMQERQRTANSHSGSSSSGHTVEERRSQAQARQYERSEYIVHEGMYETAKEIGEPGRPVHRAVRRALLAHPEYALDITGHSLGAGVASLLALMWASPNTGKTTTGSQLPPGRTTHAYAFAVPCVMGAKLGKRAESLVTSYCYSYDLVCRLSLGAILDIRNACAWLAYENQQSSRRAAAPPSSTASSAASSTTAQSTTTATSSSSPSLSSSSGYGLARPLRFVNILQRAFSHQSGRLNAQQKSELEADFLALRKTLEANMNHVELYPPGTLLYSLPAGDVSPNVEPEAARRQVQSRTADSGATGGGAEGNAARKAVLYRLRDEGKREEVFGQIIHCRGMLSRHMPHLYHYAIDAL